MSLDDATLEEAAKVALAIQASGREDIHLAFQSLLSKLRTAHEALHEIQRRTDGVTDIGWASLNEMRVLVAETLVGTSANRLISRIDYDQAKKETALAVKAAYDECERICLSRIQNDGEPSRRMVAQDLMRKIEAAGKKAAKP